MLIGRKAIYEDFNFVSVGRLKGQTLFTLLIFMGPINRENKTLKPFMS